MRLALPSLLVLSLLAVPAAQAEGRYDDPAGRFSIAVPDGWKAVKPNHPKIQLVMAKAEGTDVLGACLVQISDTPHTKSMSQAELDATLRAEMTKQFWESTYKALGGQDVVVVDVGAREHRGRNVQYVVVEFSTKAPDGTTKRLKGREEVHAFPGVVHDLGCTTFVEKFDLALADFTAILSSYETQPGLIAQAPSAEGSVMTLYANATFDGQARVVARATPDLAALGLSARTGSLAVSGFGEWQVCEGAAYTGTCTMVVGAHAAPKGGALHVRSLRPHAGVRGIASAVSTGTNLLVNEAVNHLVRR